MDNKESSKLLRFLYNTVIGRVILKLLVSPPISKLGGWYMDSKLSKVHINNFIKNNNIDMSQFEKKDYLCFNECFSRKIIEGKRKIGMESTDFISPSDSRLSVYNISDNSDFYIKKSYYTIKDLLKESQYIDKYKDGLCLIFRLCVDDYHRYCNIDNGEIIENKAIKGKLHTVRPIALRRYPVFIENSREYTVMKSENFGILSQIEVGALMIGKIQNHVKAGEVAKGTEKGMFLYGGSTIVVLVQKDQIKLNDKFLKNIDRDVETKVKYGEKIGSSLEI